MLSPKQAAQPNPSYPAPCRKDTTSPWSTDYGGNSKTLIQMLEKKNEKLFHKINKKKNRKRMKKRSEKKG